MHRSELPFVLLVLMLMMALNPSPGYWLGANFWGGAPPRGQSPQQRRLSHVCVFTLNPKISGYLQSQSTGLRLHSQLCSELVERSAVFPAPAATKLVRVSGLLLS